MLMSLELLQRPFVPWNHSQSNILKIIFRAASFFSFFLIIFCSLSVNSINSCYICLYSAVQCHRSTSSYIINQITCKCKCIQILFLSFSHRCRFVGGEKKILLLKKECKKKVVFDRISMCSSEKRNVNFYQKF